MRHGSRTRVSLAAVAVATAGLMVALAGCGAQAASEATAAPSGDATSEAPDTGITAEFVDPAGAGLGTVQITENGGFLEMSVDATGMPPGLHAFHIHTVGLCEPDSPDPANPALVGDFLSAGGHVGDDVSDHSQHAGDLPSLNVAADGTGRLVVRTDALTLDDVLDADGSVAMVHVGLDNFTNIPERYAPSGPDAETLASGDAGGRIACAVIEE